MIHRALLIIVALASSLAAQGQTTASASSTIPVTLTARQVAPAERAPLAYESPTGHILFRVKIAGNDSWGLLDTGAEVSVLDVNVAKAAGLLLVADGRGLRAPDGTVPSARVDKVSVLLPGQAEFEYGPLRATDLGMLRTVGQRTVGIVIGRDLLSHFLVNVDPDKQVLRFAPSGLFSPPPHYHALPLHDGQPTVELRVGGQPLLVLIDTGKNGDLDIQPALWDRYVPAGLAVGAKAAISLYGQYARTKHAVIPHVDLGPVELTDVEISERARPSSWGQGRIGMGIMSRFRFVIDIKARTMWFTPRNGGEPSSTSPNTAPSRDGE